jgi:dihydroorotate dehydrogenase
MGINLGKSKITPLEAAATDYVTSFRHLKTFGDYFVINVSSPNTPGLRSLQAVEQLEPILAGLNRENHDHKPIFLKIAPDLAWEDISALIKLVQTYRLAGMIATNTTILRDGLTSQRIRATGNAPQDEAGGLSGLPVRDRATEVIRFISQETQGQLPIIGVGGVFNAQDAWDKITAGASLVQVYTGWLYEGPGMVKSILKGLIQKLESHQLSSIQEAIALDQKKSSES